MFETYPFVPTFRLIHWLRSNRVRERVVPCDVLVGRRHLVAGLSEEAAERLPVPELLVRPARQERGDLRVEGRTRGEEVAQEHDRVGLDVHHVGEAPGLVLRDGMLADPVPSHGRQIDAPGGPQVLVDVELPRVHPHGRLITSADVDALRASAMIRTVRPGGSVDGHPLDHATTCRSRALRLRRSTPSAVTATMSSIGSRSGLRGGILRLDGERHPGPEDRSIVLHEVRGLVHLEADPVARTVDEALAEARRLDHRAGPPVDLLGLQTRTDRFHAGRLRLANGLVGRLEALRRLRYRHGAGRVAVVAAELPAEVHHDGVARAIVRPPGSWCGEAAAAPLACRP